MKNNHQYLHSSEYADAVSETTQGTEGSSEMQTNRFIERFLDDSQRYFSMPLFCATFSMPLQQLRG